MLRKWWYRVSGQERRAYEQYLWSEYKTGPIAERQREFERQSFPAWYGL